jgi:hypothetical protein
VNLKTLGTNQYDQTYMEQIDRSTGSIRTPDGKLIRQLLGWKSKLIYHYADFTVATTGQFVCQEYRFPMRMWDRIAKAAGLLPKPPVSERKRQAQLANAAQARAARASRGGSIRSEGRAANL